MKNTKALVVGGAGFIGSHLVDVCQREGWQVRVYDNFSTGRRSFLPDVPGPDIYEGDILDISKLSQTIKTIEPEVVFHLAAIHHIPTCEKFPAKALRVNVEGTENVINVCAEMKIPRVVFSSTGALYDPVITGLLSEMTAVKAFDIYSICKLTCEFLLQYYVEKREMEIMVARLFNTVGRRETNSHLIPAVVDQLIAGKREIRLGNVSPRRDYIHVEDVAEALFALGAMEARQPFDVFNVGTGIEHSVLELVNLFSDVVGEKVEVVSVPELQRKVDRPTQQADASKLRKSTNWKSGRTLKQALGEVWKESLDKTSKGKS